MKLDFVKMQSLGNDFVLIDNRKRSLQNIRRLSKKLCDRRLGIGADQLLLLEDSKKADFKMHIFNADGSEAEMCGNGIRCIGKYIWDKKVRSQKSKVKRQIPPYPPLLKGGEGGLAIETLGGIKRLQRKGALITVDMGEPVFEQKRIPLSLPRSFVPGGRQQGFGLSHVRSYAKPVMDYPLKVRDRVFRITCVSMGNPHAVIIVKDVRSAPVELYGPLIEKNNMFPRRTNVEFVQIQNGNSIKMRVWERGAGETTACGTGASASVVASVLLGLTDRDVTVHLPGGTLNIEWNAKDNHVYMTGPAVKVFEGTVEM